MTVPLPPVSVAGLLVPAELVPRIITALRGTYPGLTADLDDDAAVRAVLKFWISEMLAGFEATVAKAPVEDAVAETRAQYETAAVEARDKALTDAAAIVDNPGLTTPVP